MDVMAKTYVANDVFTPRKYQIKTLGCQANIADSNTMAGMLESLGFENEQSLENCDVCIINTCSVRQKSEDKVYGMGKIFLNMDRKPLVILSGCMVGSVTGERQRYQFDELKKRTPWADFYINPSQIFEIPQILKEKNILDEWALKKFDPKKVVSVQENNTHAFVNISYGCDNFCTFCVVPYARGEEVSRSREDIIGEVEHLARRGFTEITLCGQNVNSWGLDRDTKFKIRTGEDKDIPFAALLRDVHAIEDIEKISFISSNPFDFTQDLIEAVKLPKISEYMHIAVQSGSNEVLKRMNRRHTVEDFIDLIKKLRTNKPEMELGTDIIVGFPGETEDDFNKTVELFTLVKFNVAFISMYSARKGTPAQRFFKDDVPLEEKRRRHAHLTRVWKESLEV